MARELFGQSGFDVRLEWGVGGVWALGPGAGVVIVVDVLSFSTAVEVAVSRGAVVYPAAWKDARAEAFAAERGAVLSVARAQMSPDAPFSLSPASLQRLARGQHLVLPSPNGARVTREAAGLGRPVLAACLRNAEAAARAARAFRGTVSVIAVGERWPDGSLRPALEDWLGAGAVIEALGGRPSSEARAAAAAFRELGPAIGETASAQELLKEGFGEDVWIAAELNVSGVVPVLEGEAFRAWKRSEEVRA
jgi:2-phosphosulfolactate phosphatase